MRKTKNIALYVIVIIFVEVFLSSCTKSYLLLNPNNGNQVTRIEGRKGDLVTLPEPTKSSYTFLGWYDSDDYKYSGTIALLSGQMELSAKWKREVITIALNPNNGESIQLIKYDGTEKLSYPVPQKTGYVFNGWYDSNDKLYYGNVSEIEQPLELEARWLSDRMFTIDKNGGISFSSFVDKNQSFGTLIIPAILNNSVVTGISDYAFSEHHGLSSVIIPESVTRIGYQAFSGCTSLSNVIIPNSVISIGDYAFSECSAIESLEIPNSISYIGDGAFNLCTGLSSIVIPESIRDIGYGTFYGCSGLKEVVLPQTLNSIGVMSFSKCESLTSITIPASTTSIEGSSFAGCPLLERIAIDTGNSKYKSIDGMILTKDGKALVSYPSAKGEISVPKTVEVICNSALSSCRELKSISIPNSVMTVENIAFSGDTQLKSITIPSSIQSIGPHSFFFCVELRDIFYSGTKNQWLAYGIITEGTGLTECIVHCSDGDIFI